MAYYYKKRRYKRHDDGLGGVLSILVLVTLAYIYTKTNELIEQYPYGLALVISIAVLLIALVSALVVRRFLRNKHLYDAITVSAIDTMDGIEFERFLASLLRKMGYTDVQLTEKYDLGVDIVAKKDGVIWGIQAKRYNSPVKAEAVRQAYTALTRYKCTQAMVITNSTYSRPAQMLAADNNVILVDRHLLAGWIYRTGRNKPNRGAIL